MTRAPASASRDVQNGAAPACSSVTTRMPSRAGVLIESTPLAANCASRSGGKRDSSRAEPADRRQILPELTEQDRLGAPIYRQTPPGLSASSRACADARREMPGEGGGPPRESHDENAFRARARPRLLTTFQSIKLRNCSRGKKSGLAANRSYRVCIIRYNECTSAKSALAHETEASRSSLFV